MNKPRFNGTPIASLESLALMLGIDEKRLDWVVSTIPKSYKSFSIKTGKNRKQRDIFEPKRSLKIIQKKINSGIFENVSYPLYLQGGLEGRDYISNASMHTKKKSLICLDIKNFYPSISKKDVTLIFKNLMNFSPEVSSTLTEILTLNNQVPQGSCCSSYIANLLFFNNEYNIVNKLIPMGITYSRLLDDITISSDQILTATQKTKIISLIVGMVKSHRLEINEKKTTIEDYTNSNSRLNVTGLWVKHGVPKLKKADRRYIRHLVYICQKQSSSSRETQEYHDLWNRCSGKVAQMSRLNHSQAIDLREVLSKIMPTYDEFKIGKLKMLARHYESNFSKPIDEDQKKKVYRIIYDFDIVSRTDKNLAVIYRKKMRALLPNKEKK